MKELHTIQIELNAPKNQFNSFGKYKYRSCEDILEAVKPLLKKTGCVLTLSDDIIAVAERVYVKTTATIKNKDGQAESVCAMAREDQDKKGMDSAQITGSASSYARKYALNGLFAIDDSKDIDSKKPVAEENKKPALTDKRFQEAIKAINAGTYSLADLMKNFTLTDKQKAITDEI